MRAVRAVSLRIAAAAIALVSIASCGPAGNVQQLTFSDVVTGYHDEGVVNGENKIEVTVPSPSSFHMVIGNMDLSVYPSR